jgi:hypothetical protein
VVTTPTPRADPQEVMARRNRIAQDLQSAGTTTQSLTVSALTRTDSLMTAHLLELTANAANLLASALSLSPDAPMTAAGMAKAARAQLLAAYEDVTRAVAKIYHEHGVHPDDPHAINPHPAFVPDTTTTAQHEVGADGC